MLRYTTYRETSQTGLVAF